MSTGRATTEVAVSKNSRAGTWAKIARFRYLGPLVLIASLVFARFLASGPVSRASDGLMFTDVANAVMAEGKVWAEGGCWGDIDGDDDQDLLVTNALAPLRLWKNEGSGRFVDIAPFALTLRSREWVVSCAFIDLDDDGDLDLYVTERGGKKAERLGKLLRNDGRGVYTEITEEAGARIPLAGSASVDWADMDGDGDLDGFVATRWGREATRKNALFEQIGPLRFRNIAAARGLADPEGPQNAFLGSWFDYDMDGDADLLIAIDWWGVELYRNDRSTFTRVTTEVFPPATDDTPGAPPNNPMGAAWGDFDNDGCIDVFVTGINILGQGGFESRTLTDFASRLYRNDCRGRFSDLTTAAGFLPTGLVEWGANFVDFDNDGDLDLSVVTGYASPELNPGRVERLIRTIVAFPRRLIPANISAWLYRYEAMIPASGQSGPEAAMPKLLYRNQLVETGKATFVEVTYDAGVGDVGASRGSLWADIDNDGDLDWFVPSRRMPNRLYRNNGPVGNYLRVHLVGGRQRQAIGAWVKIRAGNLQQIRHVHVLDGYLSQSQIDPHFGLGQAALVDELSVRWPNTTRWVRLCERIPANRKVVVTENVGCGW